MKTISVEVSTAESARALRSSLAAFDAQLLEEAADSFVVAVDVSVGRADVVSVLHAIQQYVTNRQAGPATIEVDGRTYMMEALEAA